MLTVQIFGVKNSPATRAAERFFKERRIALHLVDLKQKPMSPGELKRFIERFGLAALIDQESAAYQDAGLKYMRLTDPDLLQLILQRMEREPKLLRLPLIRSSTNRLSIGEDTEAWKAMLTAPAK